ncbi:MAG TPA: zf-HC2 domain-containing protein [Symbiobacteriaceae bacterium]|nr:zf-HC2 domain-containing protein [Symbiobacteriaceae bacterium]
MKQCPVVQDLLPSYLHDALSPESRAMVEEHLPGCPDCQLAHDALRAGPPPLEVRSPGHPGRGVGRALGVALVLLVAAGLGVRGYGAWQADREHGRQMQARVEQEKRLLAAMREASPDPMARLRRAGVTLTNLSAARQGDAVRVEYTLKADTPADMAIPLLGGRAPSPRLLDPATGGEVGRFTQGGSQHTPGQPVTGHAVFEGAAALPAGANMQFPTLLVYMKPARELHWEVQRPFVEGEVPIGQRFTVAGVEFEAERIRFSKSGAQIDYRQLTPPAEVGLHLLSFRLSDRMGGRWDEAYRPDRLPDPARPSQTFEFVAALGKHWLVQVQHAVLVLPGPAVPMEVK